MRTLVFECVGGRSAEKVILAFAHPTSEDGIMAPGPIFAKIARLHARGTWYVFGNVKQSRIGYDDAHEAMLWVHKHFMAGADSIDNVLGTVKELASI